ncbi:MAG: FAD-dependent oxidoreductase [Opitutaceae bacterium]|nr:FAD-dependent oxidoreductase [Opitutaceae bacterium]
MYGGNAAGIAAAVQAVRMGKTVALIEPTARIGGLTTGGLGHTDIGNKQVIGGIAREFYRDIRAHYQRPEAWKWQRPDENRVSQKRLDPDAWWSFEPSAALAVLEHWLARDRIEVFRLERLDRTPPPAPGAPAPGIEKHGARITAIRTENGRVFRARVFIDATYEGDLMALAGVSYTIGREANARYGETLNGVQTRNARSHQFFPGVDPCIRKGDPASGLLPFIDPAGPGKEGAADHRVQAYCFRMCLTDHPDNRIPFAKPDGYREDWYELLLRNLEATPATATAAQRRIWINSPLPNRKTDTNNRGGFSTDFIGQNYDYPEADYKTREKIARRHLLYQQGLMWTLANHPRVPAEIRAQVGAWGMTKDEFTEGGGWQEQLYIREARRMVSALVMTQHHCQGRETLADSIGMAAYTMDSHHVQRHVDAAGHVRNEGDIQVGKFPPYPVGYRALVPRAAECDNLLVPVCLSATHIAYGSIRMEPVFMVLAQSAATAAAHAIDENTAVQKIPYARLRARLLSDGQILERPAAATSSPPKNARPPHAPADAPPVDSSLTDASPAGSSTTDAPPAGSSLTDAPPVNRSAGIPARDSSDKSRAKRETCHVRAPLKAARGALASRNPTSHPRNLS